MQYSQDPTPPGWQPTNGKNTIITETFPKEQGVYISLTCAGGEFIQIFDWMSRTEATPALPVGNSLTDIY